MKVAWRKEYATRCTRNEGSAMTQFRTIGNWEGVNGWGKEGSVHYALKSKITCTYL